MRVCVCEAPLEDFSEVIIQTDISSIFLLVRGFILVYP